MHSDNICWEPLVKNIFMRRYFHLLCNEFDCCRKRCGNVEVPAEKRITGKMLCLPTYSGLTVEYADVVCDAILKQTLIWLRRTLL